MLKRFLILFVVTYFTMSLSTSSSFQNNNLIQQKNFDLFDNNLLQLIYALHIDKDKGGNEFDIEDNNDKDDDDDDKNGKEDDEDEKEAKKEDRNDGCKDDEGENGKDDEDDNNNESNECKNENDNKNLKVLKDQESPSTNSSTGDEFTTDSSSLPSEIDSNTIDQFNALQDLAHRNQSDASKLADLSNPPPFSRFQDPLPKQPGQPLHPDLPPTPSLPPEPAEPHAPVVPPPPSE
jgi:hypothetical protein